MRKRSLGPRYWIRLLFLFVITIIITWYANQSTNNPFLKNRFIQIISIEGNRALSFVQKGKDQTKHNTLFVLPSATYSQPSEPKAFFPWSPTLFTPQKHQQPALTSAPKLWFVYSLIDTIKNVPQIESWPIPKSNFETYNESNLSIRIVHPFNNNQRALCFTYAKSQTLYLPKFQDTLPEIISSPFKEAFDLVIMESSSQKEVTWVRRLLRPLSLIVWNDDPEQLSLEPLPNVFVIKQVDGIFTIVKDRKGRIHIRSEK